MSGANKRFAPACDRNRAPILSVLQDCLPPSGHLLEISSGTGQHAAAFSSVFPGLQWQPTDLKENLASIFAWREDVQCGNMAEPFELDLAEYQWPLKRYDAMVCINAIHIVPWALVERLFEGAGLTLKPGGCFFVYGPYEYEDRPLEPSNRQFDEWLKARDGESGIRRFEAVNQLALEHGLVLTEDRSMPANNRAIWWTKDSL
ncbi:MAG: class I SAM-dependent methyltransferase [Gammaproteobacteria bacterium]|nr:class I SAM-dependent methyltransferase [Gammaproteobacteria bacterium]